MADTTKKSDWGGIVFGLLVAGFVVMIGFVIVVGGRGQTDPGVNGGNTGYEVQCNDGTWSTSGGIQGACSWHGGER